MNTLNPVITVMGFNWAKKFKPNTYRPKSHSSVPHRLHYRGKNKKKQVLLKKVEQQGDCLVGGVGEVAAMENLRLLWGIMGPGVAGAVFGAGWWFWVDAVVCSSVQVSFLHYLPGEREILN
jgi:hypothetical protein